MKKKINPPQCLIKVWEKNFYHEQSKFINTTHLIKDDLNSHFLDAKGDRWEIIGQMENSDLVCRNDRTGFCYTWDKWKVSQLKYPEKHVIDKPDTKKTKTSIKEEKKKDYTQLALDFDEPEDEEKVIVDDDEIESIDLDEVDIPIEDDIIR